MNNKPKPKIPEAKKPIRVNLTLLLLDGWIGEKGV